eukprot:CAMPEP_0176151328 /NCGR_PEP_ID=MMETSP0120_2-20121206/77278_1 /TAXON_ID=160619 /ORGANISM="Kryptoperidinium foliaceum, Strain CCMP 1326" /LENGTH=188 /DNA_ID=CAMNT_0017488289 /DNA_START=1 /DNA_END=564 /DNA_ORIENTATION=+
MKDQLDDSRKEKELLKLQLHRVEKESSEKELYWKKRADEALQELEDLKKQLVISAISGLANNDQIQSNASGDSTVSSASAQETLESTNSTYTDDLCSRSEDSVQTKTSFNDKLCEKSRQMMKRNRQMMLRKNRRSTGSMKSENSPPKTKCINDKLCEKSRQMMLRKQRRSLDRVPSGEPQKNTATRIV